jgi:hypothetical protein
MSVEAEKLVQALLTLVRNLEAENAALKEKLAMLDGRSAPKPLVSDRTSTIKATEESDGVVRARAREFVAQKEAKAGNGPNVREVVRGKREREAMQGYECDQCKEFYDAVGILPTKCSKHRYHRPPNEAPEEFWEGGNL